MEIDSEIIGEIVDIAQDIIETEETKKVFYNRLIRVLEKADENLAEEILGIDDTYDEVYEDFCSPAPVDEEYNIDISEEVLDFFGND